MEPVMILHDDISPATWWTTNCIQNAAVVTWLIMSDILRTEKRLHILMKLWSAQQVLLKFSQFCLLFWCTLSRQKNNKKNAARRRRVGNMNHFRWKQLGHVCFGTIRYHFQSGFSDFAIFTWLRAHRLQSGSHCLLAWDKQTEFHFRNLLCVTFFIESWKGPENKSVLNVIDGSW